MVQASLHYVRGVISELRKVSFPSRMMVIKETGLVVISIVAAVVGLVMVDYTFKFLVGLLIS